MTDRMTSEWEASQPAHIVLYTSSVDQGTVDALARTRGVAEIEPAVNAGIQWKRPGEAEWRNADLSARQDYEHQRQDMVRLLSGVWPHAERNAIVVERQSSIFFNVPLGSAVMIKTARVEREMKVVGVARRLTEFPPQFGGNASFFATPETLRDILDMDGFNQLNIRLSAFDKSQAQSVANQLKRQLERGGASVGTPDIQDPKRHFIQDTLDAIFLLMGAIGALSLAISTFLIVNTINAVLAQQVSQIGVMKAVGATTDRIVRVYFVMVLVYGLCAIALAVPLAALLANLLGRSLLALLNIELSGMRFAPQAVLVQVAIGLIAPMLAAAWPVLAGARISVRQAMASYGLGADFGRSWLDKLIANIRGLPRPLVLSLRNTFRRKGRVMLTLITLIAAGVMFIMVMSIGDTFTYTTDQVFAAYNFDVWLVLDNAERFERVEAIAASVPGVVGSEVMLTPRGTLEFGGEKKREVVFWAMLPETTLFNPTITAGRWLRPGDQNRLVLNQRVAQEEGVQVGDLVTVNLGEGKEATWEIVGLLVDINNQGDSAYAPRDAISRQLRQFNRGSTIWIKTEQHDRAYQTNIEKQLRAAFKANSIDVSFSITSAQNIEMNRTQFSLITNLLLTMSVLAGLVGSLGLMGTMSINVLERSKEIGVMRAIGATSGAIIGIFIVEGVILGMMSVLVATPLSYPGARLVSDALGNMLFKMPMFFHYSTSGVFLWIAIMIVLAALASLWPALRAARLSVRETLAYE
jgi:putative ABC transport system permease protein